ncbi:MAG: alpha/beta hydrolase [Pseudomonadota bacterium]
MSYNYDPELAELLEFIPEGNLDLTKPVETRMAFIELINQMNAELDTRGVTIENRSIDGPAGAPEVPIRIYSPEDLSGTVPAVLHIHGGGFVVGNLDSEMGACIGLCRELGVVVVSVDYRLAPEDPFPAGLEDCYTTLCWIHDTHTDLSIDPERVAVLGMSAGGGLSAATALAARDRGGPAICFQFLGIPELDDRLVTHSMDRFHDTPMWNRPNAELSWEAYLGQQYQRGADDVPYLAAPARCDDLSDLPPAYISTMEFDPLRDEGIHYALQLLKADVTTELHNFAGTFHGSTLFAHAQISQRELAEQLTVLRRALDINA